MKRVIMWALVGLAFLAPLKFGTPVVLQCLLPPPSDPFQWLFFSWPNQIGVLLAVTALAGALGDRLRNAARADLLFLLPGLLLCTQLATVRGSINHAVSVDTVWHMTVCVLLFYAAAWYVRDGAAVSHIFGGLGLAMFVVCSFGLEQWMGGLEATRKMATAAYTQAPLPADLMSRLQSDRIFSTLVYPNALAGFIVVGFAPVIAWVWVRGRQWETRFKWATLALAAGVMVFCLMLTGSRGGFAAFALAIMAGAAGLLGRKARGALLGVAIGLLALFALAAWSGWIHLGRTSLEARLDYWSGGVRIIKDYPLQGTGPGTFGSIYPHYKTGETEEAQVAHNNFLQMWTDSGVAAFAMFLAMWCVGLRDAFRLMAKRPGDAGAVAIFAALVGWTLHGFVDFDLYVPGVAYPAFILLGAVQGLKDSDDSAPAAWLARWHWLGKPLAAALVVIVWWTQGTSLVACVVHGQAHEVAQFNPQGAHVLAKRAVELEPRNSHYLADLATLATSLGYQEEAIGWFQQALDNDPYRASYHWHFAMLLGPSFEGVQHLREAVALNPTKVQYRQALRSFEESVRQGRPRLLESVPASKP